MSVSTIEEYYSNINNDGKQILDEFISFMSEEFPNLKCKICFSMPMWFFHEKMKDGYIAISCATKHFSIHFSNEEYIIELINRYPSLKFGTRCANIKYSDTLGKAQIKEAIKEAVNRFL